MGLIDISSFNKNWGIVSHHLPADYWSWEKISLILEQKITDSPERYTKFSGGGFNVSGLDSDPLCEKILNFLKHLNPQYHTKAELYAGVNDNSKSFDLHVDPGQHLWIWQILGNTPWQVEDSIFILEKNQVLYITPGLKHCALPNSPRASITFSLEEY